MREICVLVVADESMVHELLEKVLLTHFHEFKVVGQVASSSEAIRAVSQLKPQVVIVDLQLQTGDATNIISSCSHFDIHTVFITSFNDDLIEALQFANLDFVFKPFDISDLISTLDKVSDDFKEPSSLISHQHKQNTLIHNLKTSSKKIILYNETDYRTQPLSQIVWAEAQGNKSLFHFTDGTSFEAHSPLRRFESMLQMRSFYRCHPYNLINLMHIENINPFDWVIEMKNGDHVEFEERKYNYINALLQEEKNSN
jgi:two-component system LytT family response regulator